MGETKKNEKHPSYVRTAPIFNDLKINSFERVDKKEKTISDIRKEDSINALEEAKRMAMATKEIESLKGLVPKTVIERLKKQAGLTDLEEDDKDDDKDNEINPMLWQVLQEEKDPKVRQTMIMAALGGKGGKNNMVEMMMMANLMNPQKNNNEVQESSITSKLLDRFVDSITSQKEPEEKVLEKFKLYKEIFGTGGTNSLEGLLQSKKTMEELGLINNGPDKELELALKKMDIEYGLKKEELNMEKEKSQQYSDIIENGASALLTALPEIFGKGGGQKEISNKNQNNPQGQFIPIECPKCKRKMNIPEPFNKRKVKCSTKECPIMFDVEGDGNAYFDQKQMEGENHGNTETES